MEDGYLKAEVQSLGVRFSKVSDYGRYGGAGPAEGIILLFNGIKASVPVRSGFVASSPYSIHREDGGLFLAKDGGALGEIHLPSVPAYYRLNTQGGIPYRKIALMHGTDCLGSTVIQSCEYWNSKLGCKFCGIGLSLKSGSTIYKKTPHQLAEVAQAASKHDGVKHITLTSGSTQDGSLEIKYLASCAKEIKRRTNLPIHVQFVPPKDLGLLEVFKEAGVDTCGIHAESFDSKVLKKIAPFKAAIGLTRFIECWRRAVEIFGPNQVSSFIIAGVGEEGDSIINGSRMLCELGVYPFILPLRPIPGTKLGNQRPPEPEHMIRIYEEVSQILKTHKLSSRVSKAGCVRCGACSALPDFEENRG